MNRVQLRDDLVMVFSTAELGVLCRRLDVQDEALGGKVPSDKVSSLIGLMERSGRLQELVVEMVRERPHLRHAYAEYLPGDTAVKDTNLDWLDRMAAGEGPAIEEPPTMRWDSDLHESDE